jgi:hypothetical protein
MLRTRFTCLALISLALGWGEGACSDDSTGENAGAAGSAGTATGGSGAISSGGSGNSSAAGSGGTHSAGSAGVPASGSGGSPSAGPSIAGCPVFPAADDWNTDISAAQSDAAWTQKLQSFVGSRNLHPDFGSYAGGVYGIPINVVPANQATSGVSFDYAEESDPGPYPFPDPASAKIEGGTASDCSGDCHLLVVQQGVCILWEGYACQYSGAWKCGSGARWDLTRVGYGQRTMGWTSADAAGLPITPGLLRYDEVAAGEVRHAIRFTLHCSINKYVKPATHFAGSCDSDPNAPPMGLRVRLKATYDLSKFNQTAQVVLRAMQRYGMIMADNGSDFYFQGEVSDGWTEDIEALKAVPASEFEVIAPGPLQP